MGIPTITRLSASLSAGLADKNVAIDGETSVLYIEPTPKVLARLVKNSVTSTTSVVYLRPFVASRLGTLLGMSKMTRVPNDVRGSGAFVTPLAMPSTTIATLTVTGANVYTAVKWKFMPLKSSSPRASAYNKLS